MKRTLIAAASIVALTVSGAAFAQGTPAKNDMERTATWQSDEERMMYENDRDLYAPFFNDDWSAYRTDDEIRDAFAAMGADDQASMREACDRAALNPGSYGTVTNGLCGVVGETASTN
jgi:hypothetical protein